jgi:hypothetical protein
MCYNLHEYTSSCCNNHPVPLPGAWIRILILSLLYPLSLCSKPLESDSEFALTHAAKLPKPPVQRFRVLVNCSAWDTCCEMNVSRHLMGGNDCSDAIFLRVLVLPTKTVAPPCSSSGSIASVNALA